MKRKRLVLREEVEDVFRKGKKYVSDQLTLLLLENQSDDLKYTIHVRKKLGHAVERNRAKRLYREALCRQVSLKGHDLIVIPRKEIKNLSLKQVTDYLEQVLCNAGISKKK